MSAIQGAVAGVILAALAGLILILCVQHYQIIKDQEQAQQLLQEKAALQFANDNWKVFATEQNKKMAQLVTRQNTVRDAAAKAIAAAQRQAKRAAKLATQIASLKTSSDDCASAKAVKDFYLRNRK